MLRNHLTIALRSLLRNRLVSGINIGGLALGVACSLLIGLWVLDELRFDQFLPNQDRVFRFESTTKTPDGTTMNLAAVGWPVGKILQRDYPEVERLTYLKGWSPQFKHKGVYVKEKALMADEQFFNVLGYELAQGNPKTALNEPFSVILSPEAEEKYFGRGKAMGKVLMVSDTLPHRVTGILRDVPRNGHLQFSMIRSMASLYALYPQDMQYELASGWFDINVANYVLLKPGVDAAAFGTKISTLVAKRGAEAVKKTGMNSTLHLRALPDIYLHSNMPTLSSPVGNSQTLNLFVAIGLFILLIACLNVINLSTARATDRANEVGVRKVLGIGQGPLVRQFMVEAALTGAVAIGLGTLLAGLALPLYTTFTGKPADVADLLSPTSLGLLFGLWLLIVPLTGFYPAWVLSRFQPIMVLKGRLMQSAQGVWLRKGLVVAQFAVSVCLIVGTLAAWRQVRFLQQHPLGFNQQQVVVVDLLEASPQTHQPQARLLREELLKHSQIRAATGCYAVPGQSGWEGQFAYGEGNAPGKGILVEHIPVDAAFAGTLGLRIVAGRDFVPNSKADEGQSFLINEAAANAFGWGTAKAAVGKKLSASGVNGVVVGVVNDYHQHGLQGEIRPVIMNVMQMAGVIAFRYEGRDPSAALAHLETTWKRLFPGYALTYSFLDEAFQQQYVAEQKLIRTVSVAAGLAILIACLGLFGLATFTAQQRTKEIGVRKVLGASVTSIVTLLSGDFLKLVLIAIGIASPLAWWAMNRWLGTFAYRAELSWWLFAAAGTLAVLVALLTVSFQSIRAALVNPVRSLRNT